MAILLIQELLEVEDNLIPPSAKRLAVAGSVSSRSECRRTAEVSGLCNCFSSISSASPAAVDGQLLIRLSQYAG